MIFSNRLRGSILKFIIRRMASDGRYIGTSKRGESCSGLTKEFSFPVPWGQVAGKTWGDERNPPIVCLHGWLDNCNTFDKLIPLLPQDYYYVAMDMPGHGLSSHYEVGAFYFTISFCGVIKRLIDHFKFKHVTILGHSMGANVGAYFGCIYPEIVKRVILIDTAGVWFRTKDDLVNGVRSCLDSHLAFETSQRKEKEYTYEEAVTKLQNANLNLNEEAVKILIERGTKENENGMFTFRRDLRHLFKDTMERNLEVSLFVVESIEADVLFIWGKEGLFEGLKQRFTKEFDLVRKTYEKHAKSATFLSLEGNHFLHLCTPEETAEKITKFFEEHPFEIVEEKLPDSSNL